MSEEAKTVPGQPAEHQVDDVVGEAVESVVEQPVDNADKQPTESVTEQLVDNADEQLVKSIDEQPVDNTEDEPVVKQSVKDGVEQNAKNEELEEEMDDLFGEDDEEGSGSAAASRSASDDDDDDRPGYESRHNRLGLDDEEAEEQAMYTRKFYGEEAENMSEEENALTHFKEENVELVRHIVPYRAIDGNSDEKPTIYYAKVPEFLTIDPVPFDPPSFETKVKERLANFSSKEDQLGDSLIDENTIRWRYSRDEQQHVYKESNAQIIEWSDGRLSLKLGDEYTDILVNDTENTFFAVSHDQQELMQCSEGGEITKSLMFIPTSTSSKMHQKLTKAVTRRNKRQATGPGIYIINKDPEVEKYELERQQQQRVRERRKRQLKEVDTRDSPDTAGSFEYSSGYKKNKSSSIEPEAYAAASRRNEYEQDDFLVDDDDDEEVEYDDEDEDEDDLVGDGDDDQEDDGDEDASKADRLRQLKSEGASKYQQSETHKESETETRRRKVAVIDDDEDDE